MSSASDDDIISILSLNCWGLKYVSKYRVARLDAIANRIADSTYDIVALQEVWVYSDFENIVKKTSHILPYAKFYFSGVLGGGLAILSKWPLESTTMWRYPLNGRPIAFWRGDWYVGKGVASALIRHPSGQLIEVFNTHLHAPYGHGEDTYLCHRTAQAWDIAKLLRASVQRGTVAIGVGDFNAQPGSLAHRLITTHGLVSDSWLAAHPDSLPRSSSSDILSLSDRDKIRLLGVTCDSKLNTWRAYDLAKDMDDPSPKRLDYVFVNQDRVQVQDTTVVFTERVPHLNCSYADHFGIEVKLQLRSRIKDGGETAISDEGTLSQAMFDMIDHISERYLAREIRHSRWRNRHFIASVWVFIGLLIGQWWVTTNYGHFIVLLGAVVVMVTGTVDGLIGFVFGRWEIGALKEFISEVRLARKVYLGDRSSELY